MCEGCKFWSEMIAESKGGGPLKAMCLNDKASCYQDMVHEGCNNREEGPSIDEPGYSQDRGW